MRVKAGFHWKTIEEKPENWESMHRLIMSAQDRQEDKKVLLSSTWNNVVIFRLFTQEFPDLKMWWIDVPDDKGEQKKVSNKKQQSSSRKHEIHRKLEEERIKKDFQKFRINEKTWYTHPAHFDFEVNQLLFAIWWNGIFFRRKKAPTKLVLLDAILSFQRLVKYYESSITEKWLRAMVDRVMKDMTTFINDDMYTLLFNHPHLLVETSLDRQTITKKLYPEQCRILDMVEEHVRQNRPLLLGNQMPTGTGKTFLSVPLAMRLSTIEKIEKTVLFCCSNELVCQDVASTALLADTIHLWMAKLVQDEDTGKPIVLLRPYKRCFPSKWKKIYHKLDTKKKGSVEEQWKFYKDATGRIPNIIVSDLEAGYHILKSDIALKEEAFVAYIDEYVSDDYSNELMAHISTVLPRHTVLLSSILPTFDRMSNMVTHFQKCHGVPVEPKRVTTADVNICCAIVDEDGLLRMPHHQCETEEDVHRLVKEIRVNPRIRRCYSPKHVYYWAMDIRPILEKHGMHFKHFFPDIGSIQTRQVLDYSVAMLELLESHPQYLMDYKRYRPRIMEAPSKLDMFKKQAMYYEGKTLFISTRVFSDVLEMTTDLIDPSIQYRHLEEQMQKKKEIQQNLIAKMEKSRASKDDKMRDRGDVEEMHGDLEIRLPPQMVVNSEAHFTKYHPDKKTIHHRVSVLLPDEISRALSDQMLLWIMAGIGVYSISQMTDYERVMVMRMYSKLAFLCSDKSIVFGTNLPNLTNIFIDEEFARVESIPTLYQLMGRVGRMGRSYHANIILNSALSVSKILSLDDNIDQGGAHSSNHSMDIRISQLLNT